MLALIPALLGSKCECRSDQASTTTPVKGTTGCKLNDPDCNRCTNDVIQQFSKIKRGEATWKSKPWRFEWGTGYPPSDITPYLAFDEDSPEADILGISSSHPQGFVRTNVGARPYAGSHSRTKDAQAPGTIFIVRQDSTGKKFLAALYSAHTHHPSGVHALGKYVIYGERPKGGDNELRIVDIARPFDNHDITHTGIQATGESAGMKMFGGGIGIVKLEADTYLLVSSLPGSNKPGPRYNQFFRLKGNLEDPSSLTIAFVNEQRYENPSTFARDYRFSENMSLITECNTGNIYAVHTSGNKELLGTGYWRLSRLATRDNHFKLLPIDVYEMPQNTADCHMRSAATVGVAPNGSLELLCHQYRKDPDPSVLNPLNFNTSGKDSWKFRAGLSK